MLDKTPVNSHFIIIHSSINTLYLVNEILQYWPNYLQTTSFIIRLNDGEEKLLPPKIEQITQKFTWLSGEKIVKQQREEGQKIYFSDKPWGKLVVQNGFIDDEAHCQPSITNNHRQHWIQVFLSNHVDNSKTDFFEDPNFNIALIEESLIPQQFNHSIDIHLKTWQIADYITRFITHWSYLQPFEQNEQDWKREVALLLNSLQESNSSIDISVDNLFRVAKRMTLLKKIVFTRLPLFAAE